MGKRRGKEGKYVKRGKTLENIEENRRKRNRFEKKRKSWEKKLSNFRNGGKNQ